MSSSQSLLELKSRINSYLSAQAPRINLNELCFDKQLAFISDPSLFSTALTSRRAGKTTACALDLLHTAITYPSAVCLYVTLARTNAKRIIWPMLCDMNKELKLGGIENISDLSMTMPNGSRIYCSGAATSGEIDRFLGLGLKLVYIDECFHADTVIDTPAGPVAISKLQVGDDVLNAIGVGKVTSISRKNVASRRLLEYGGRQVICSSNHPFFTERGWIAAADLQVGEQLALQSFSMRLLREGFYKGIPPHLSLLLTELLREASTHKEQSHEQAGGAEKGFFNAEENEVGADGSSWQWHGSDRSRKGTSELFTRIKVESRNIAWKAGAWLSDKLQGRCGAVGREVGDRGRWIQSSCHYEKSTRQEKGSQDCFVRLDRNEIYKPRDSHRNRECDFYDIGVSGHPSFSVNGALVHNCQSFGTYLRQLIDRVLVPACFDNKGRIKLIGTPPPVPVGFFIDALQSDGWSHHAWNMFENPWILKKRGESPEEILRQELERRGVAVEDPTIQREIFGRLVTDTQRLVIEYDASRNHFDVSPAGKLHYLMGIDLGFQDADAIVVLGYNDNSPTTYLIEECITVKQGLTELVSQIETLRNKYDAHRLMIDTGGLGLKLAEEMRRRYAIPVIAAEKTRKFETIELFNDALRTGRFMASKHSRFASDAMLLEWDMDKLRPDKKFVSDRFHSDIIDAVLYAFRESPAYAWEPKVILPKWGTPEWGKREEKQMEEQAEERYRELEQGPDDLHWL